MQSLTGKKALAKTLVSSAPSSEVRVLTVVEGGWQGAEGTGGRKEEASGNSATAVGGWGG